MGKKRIPLRHVHLGTGAFGLGFVVPLVSAAGFQTVLANRARGSAAYARNVALQRHGSYSLVLMGKQPRTEEIPIAEFIFVDENEERFLDVVADPATRLCTTALRQGFLASVPLLADALAYRLESGTTTTLYVVACETPAIGDSSTLRTAILSHRPELATRVFEQRIHFVPCIVDRICNDPVLHEDTGRVSVTAEEFAEWLLQGPSPLERVLLTKRTEKTISFVNDFAPFARRKLWLVNGPHLLIALRAFVQHQEYLNRFLAEKENARLLTTILREAQDAFLGAESFFSKTELTHYTNKIRARFSSFPDSTTRHLPRIARPRIHEFMADFYKKSGVIQLPHALKRKRVAYQTAQTLLLTTELIANGRYAYDDAGQPIPIDGNV